MNRREFFQTSAAGAVAGVAIPASAIIRSPEEMAEKVSEWADFAERLEKAMLRKFPDLEQPAFNDDVWYAVDQIFEREGHRSSLTEAIYGLNPQ